MYTEKWVFTLRLTCIRMAVLVRYGFVHESMCAWLTYMHSMCTCVLLSSKKTFEVMTDSLKCTHSHVYTSKKFLLYFTAIRSLVRIPSYKKQEPPRRETVSMSFLENSWTWWCIQILCKGHYREGEKGRNLVNILHPDYQDTTVHITHLFPTFTSSQDARNWRSSLNSWDFQLIWCRSFIPLLQIREGLMDSINIAHINDIKYLCYLSIYTWLIIPHGVPQTKHHIYADNIKYRLILKWNTWNIDRYWS